MSEFNILDHLDKLKPDKGSAGPGEQSFYCPACKAKNFKVHLTSGVWGAFSCDCAATESGKRKIRNALSPAINPNKKDLRPKQHRAWDYHDIDRNYLFTVHRWDDPFTTDNRFANGRCIRQSFSPVWEDDIDRQQWRNGAGQTPKDLKHLAVPLGLQDALEALADGAPFVYAVEGEPCVDAMRAAGLPAITSLGGAGKFNPERDGGHIPPDRLVVVPDRDQPGLKHAQRVADAHPGCQWLYPFPGTPQWNGSCPASGGLDIADWIAQGATVEQILAGVGQRLESKPQSTSSKSDRLDEWDELLACLVNPKHLLFERNTVRRQIRAATAAAEVNLRVSPQQVRSRLIAKQRELITGKTTKGTAGGQKVKAPGKKWLINDLIPMHCLTAIAAFAKVGKTKFLCALAASLIHQKPLMGNAEWKPAPGPHKIILWLTDQPAADTNGYLQAVGLQQRDGTLHPSIVKLYTEEDDLAWDDQGIDQLIEDITANPGAILITDSFFANVQRPYGSDQEPEAGGALIDLQTLLGQSGTTHICAWHSPKETGLTGVNALRGHGSAAGAVSLAISLSFLERKDPSGNGKWVADKENPHRRMVVEGRAPYRDLLVRLDGESGTWTCHGDFSTGLAQLAQGEQVDELTGLTKNQRDVLDVIGLKSGLTIKQIAYEWKQHEPIRKEIEQCRNTVRSLCTKRLVKEKPAKDGNTYSIRKSLVREKGCQTVDSVGIQSGTGISPLVETVGGSLASLAAEAENGSIAEEMTERQRSNPLGQLDSNGVGPSPTISANGQNPDGDWIPMESTISEDSPLYARGVSSRGSGWDTDDGDDPYWPPRQIEEEPI